MRILFLVSSMEGGGAERVAALLSNAWVEKRHQVTLMPTFSGRGGSSYPLDPRVELRYLADITRTRLARTPLGRLLALRRAIHTSQPDVVVSFLTNVNVAAILAAGPVPTIVSERIYPPLMPLPRVWEVLRRLTYPRAACVVMQTAQGLAWLHQAIPGAKGVVVANPLEMPLPTLPPRIEPSSVVPAGAKLLLSVGRLDPQKNFKLLIEAFAQLTNSLVNWHLAILGEGSERASLEALITQRGLQDHVSLPGRSGDAGAWYARASAFALTSRFEGFPNALLEALGHGVPSLALDCPSGPADLIEPGRNGMLLPGDATRDVLAQGLEQLITCEWPHALADAAAVRERYAVSAIADEWLALFEIVCARS